MTEKEINQIRGFICEEEQSDKKVTMEVTMSNNQEYYVDTYSTHCFADEYEYNFLAIYGDNVTFLSLEHILAAKVISKDKKKK